MIRLESISKNKSDMVNDMGFGNARMDAALDNFITGHWGEDQFRGQEEWEMFVEKTCASCPCEKWCPVCEKFYSGDDDLYDNPCIVIKSIMDENNRIQYEMDLKMEEEYEREQESALIEESGVYVSLSANENWFNNYIQFTRLLAEFESAGCISINQDLLISTGLCERDVNLILERAQFAYEKICEQLKYRQEKENILKSKTESLNFDENIFNKDLEKAAMADFMRDHR